jgi:CysZ protein
VNEVPAPAASVARIDAARAVSVRPGRLRRAAAGAWHVPAGLFFLACRPRLWPLVILPAIIGAVLIVAGLALGIYSMHLVEEVLAPSPGRVPAWLGMAITLALWIATAAGGILAGFALALLLSAPILDQLSRRVEQLMRGSARSASRGLRWEVAHSLKASLFLVAAAPLALALGMLPLVGPLVSLVWSASVVAYQQTDAALARRGLAFADRREWHRKWRWESLGFGLAGMVLLAVPVVDVLLGPALVVGGTRLVLESEDFV